MIRRLLSARYSQRRHGPAWVAALGFALGLAGCAGDDSPAAPEERSTWQIVQQEILASNCAGCHAPGTSFARQSGLVMTPEEAYAQLVNALPTNPAARQEGLVRVSNEGLAGLYKSYLWEKINAPNQEHFYADHPRYGGLMPLGGDPLTNGELEFIRQWIAAGAPERGTVADPALLEDRERYQVPQFRPLASPARGIQLHLGPFEVAPNFERELFSMVPMGNQEAVYVERFEIAMRAGSHHFLIYTFQEETPAERLPVPYEYRELRDAQGQYVFDTIRTMVFHLPLVGSQWPFVNFHFPPGVALRLEAGALLDLNSHYVNRTGQSLQGEVYANLHLADPAQVQRQAQILALSNFDIRLPPGKKTTLEKDFIFPEKRHLVQLVSHAHEHLVEFRALVMGGQHHGELVYVAYDWEHPPVLELDPPLVLEAGQGLKLMATYDNPTDRELSFGFLSQDEMMILYGFYYVE